MGFEACLFTHFLLSLIKEILNGSKEKTKTSGIQWHLSTLQTVTECIHPTEIECIYKEPKQNLMSQNHLPLIFMIKLCCPRTKSGIRLKVIIENFANF